MARVGLVGDEVGQLRSAQPGVGVDRDRRPEPPVVAGEPAPRSVPHHLERHGLTVGQPERVAGPRPQRRSEGGDRRTEPLEGDGLAVAEGGQPLREPARTREQAVERGVGGAVTVLVAEPDRHAVPGPDLLDEPDGLAREPACGHRDGAELSVEEGGASGTETGVGELATQPGRGPREVRGPRLRARRGVPAQRRVAGVGVHRARHEPVQAQPQQQVVAHQQRPRHTRNLLASRTVGGRSPISMRDYPACPSKRIRAQ